MTLATLAPLADHLWQSTLFAALVFGLTVALRKNSPEVRYRLWFAASLKFALPFALLVGLGRQIDWYAPAQVADPVKAAIGAVNQPFAASLPEPAPQSANIVDFPWVQLLAAVWLAGFLVALGTWTRRWLTIRTAVRVAQPLDYGAPVPVFESPGSLEPGVFGLFRPVILLPQSIVDRLSGEQLTAILAHELCHIRRRDNLAAAMHMFVAAAFWFHPLVWFIGARLMAEREHACDLEVLRNGSQPLPYAEGILTVCRYYIQSPLPCAAGVSGADLKQRIQAIMADQRIPRLSGIQKAALGAAAAIAVSAPLFLGLAQNAKPLVWEVATIKPTDPDNPGNPSINVQAGGALRIRNRPFSEIAAFAFDVQPFQITGGPSWITSEKWDIQAKLPAGEETNMENIGDEARSRVLAQLRERMRNLLIERFQLTTHWDSKATAVYALVIGRTGPKLKETDAPGNNRMGGGPGRLGSKGGTMDSLARSLSMMTGRPVEDRTGLKGNYDFDLTWSPDPGPLPPPGEKPTEAYVTDPNGPSLFTALQEQLGLKLEAARGSLKLLVIDRVAKPSAN